MSKVSVLTIRVPHDLKGRIEIEADKQGVSINQLAMYMFTREISSLEAGEKISPIWRGYTKKELETDFDNVMAKVRKRQVPPWDRIDP